MIPIRSRRFLKALALFALATLVATGLASGAARHARHRSARHPRAHAATYSILSRETSAADTPDEALTGAAREDEKLQAAEARLLGSNADGRTWLIPTSAGELCVGVEPAGQYEALEQQRGLEHLRLAYACNPVAAAEADGVAVRVYDEVVGVVPDGVSSVTVDIAGQAPMRKTVTGNTYRFSVPDGFDEGEVSFTDESGTERNLRL